VIGYAALREAAAWRDVSSRGRLRVTGEDRARFLHAMTTNHVEQLKPGEGCYAFFLSAQGRVLADVNIFCRPDHLLLDTEPETAEKVREHLDHYIIADDVTVEDIAAETVAIAVEGPRAADALRKAGAPAPGAEFASELWGERLVSNVSYTGLPGWLVVAPALERGDVVGHLKAAGAIVASESDFHVARLENGHPRYGEDITERYLAQETNQLRAIHFQKGCYLGQEIVERVRSRAQIHRILMPLKIEGMEAPAPGTKLQADGRDAAEITSSAYSPALGHVVALAYVRSEHAQPGSVLDLAGRRAAVR